MLNPFNWYWLADDGRLFSSASQSLIQNTDHGYQAWVAAGGQATRWPTDNSGAQTTASLQDVLTPYNVFASLQGYAAAKQAKIASGGVRVNVGTSGSPINVEASTDVTSLILLQGAATIAASNPTQTFQWVPHTGAPITLTAAQITTMFGAVSTFLQSTFSTLSSVIAAINAGTITTTAQVDNPPSPIAAWPVNS